MRKYEIICQAKFLVVDWPPWPSCTTNVLIGTYYSLFKKGRGNHSLFVIFFYIAQYLHHCLNLNWPSVKKHVKKKLAFGNTCWFFVPNPFFDSGAKQWQQHNSKFGFFFFVCPSSGGKNGNSLLTPTPRWPLIKKGKKWLENSVWAVGKYIVLTK